MGTKSVKPSGKEEVDAYMSKLEHPYKAEIEQLRGIILNASSEMAERIKWNAPSFYMHKDFAAFNLRQRSFLQVVFVFYDGFIYDDATFLQGAWIDRRVAAFNSMDDVLSKQSAIEAFVHEWIKSIKKTANI
ncbi:DUF1801 domain-containing protein [Pedobacter sandarakinus]|uniref:DUF1801 domain-containing protein n=1 Tax=Pedobacter sandarakinus TaxID=353156 RepID=UPI002247B049|nr:DUF1801 domain-containing protein [Pedobacter sandarakinus]MCX2575280.1 DUF1801 domain-containing protein [Pedobacter sandarakinus]